jgi:hypothetical protein
MVVQLYLKQTCCLLYADVVRVDCFSPAAVAVTFDSVLVILSVRAEVLVSVEADAEWLVAWWGTRWRVNADFKWIGKLFVKVYCILFCEIEVLLFNAFFSNSSLRFIVFLILNGLLSTWIDHDHILASKFPRFKVRRLILIQLQHLLRMIFLLLSMLSPWRILFICRSE